ncbi:MAG: hypothetical protein ABIK07_03835 [Planctomycetota bacterium]
MTQQYVVLNDNNESGPFTAGQLVAMSRDGQLRPFHKVRDFNSNRWFSAKTVRGLAFPENAEDVRLRDAFLALVDEISTVLIDGKLNKGRNELALNYLSDHCCDNWITESIIDGNAERLSESITIAVGHDVLYWVIIAILADGKVQQEELESVGLLVKEIANAYAIQFERYSKYSDMEITQLEKFLASFKKDRSHYGWPTGKSSSNISTDAFLGAPVAVAASLYKPDSNCLRAYKRLVETCVTVIVQVDTLTVEEQAIMVRAKRLLEELSRDAIEIEAAARRKVSPLLEQPNLITSSKSSKEPTRTVNFRKVSWGMTRSEVIAAEENEIAFETDSAIFYEGTVAGLDALIIYVFAAGICIRAKYSVKEEHSNQNRNISDYIKIRELLVDKYGPVAGKDDEYADMFWFNDLYQDEYDSWGLAVSIGHLHYMSEWKTLDTKIGLVLHGDNYDMVLSVEYSSVELAHLEDQIEKSQHLDEL